VPLSWLRSLPPENLEPVRPQRRIDSRGSNRGERRSSRLREAIDRLAAGEARAEVVRTFGIDEAMTTRSVNEALIVALRDNAMAILKQGAWHDDGKGHRLLIRETEDLRLAYAGPLQMGAEEMSEELKYFAAATGRSGHLPHELSVWRKAPSQKVLNVTWDDPAKIELITYEPGEWEARLASEEGK
jgi:hypothetical protein